MNRLILIGNGFDLAHGLHTSYKHFIDKYWADFEAAVQYRDTGAPWYVDEFIAVNYRYNGNFSWPGRELDQQALSLIRKKFHNISESGIQIVYKNSFFAAINRKLSEQKWVDIENEYYRLLKDIYDRHTKKLDITSDLEKLNADFAAVKEKLVDYLKQVQKEKIKEEIVNEQIKKIIYKPFDVRDISNEGQGTFSQFIKHRFGMAANIDTARPIISKYYSSHNGGREWSDVQSHINRKNMDATEHENWIRSEDMKNAIPDFFLLPNNILFLNFNYTETASLYPLKGKRFKLNNIHGELVNDKNPIIFGYGDEIDEHYKKIAEQNENKYLNNIKSIRYLETDNYRRLLTFIDSAPYQIYTMGHSSGNSDRTLLNTLFEHRNCVSIKPFYYKESETKDDYIDIVQNISRNFKDPALMRDRVVNKTYCEPLPQNPPAVTE